MDTSPESAIRLQLLAVFLLIVPAMACSDDDYSERVGTTHSEIQNGMLDDGTASCPSSALVQPPFSTAVGCFPEVVKLGFTDPQNNTFSCSGSLISPSTVLFARHCLLNKVGQSGDPVNPQMIGRGADFSVRGAFDPSLPNPAIVAVHTFVVSGLVSVRDQDLDVNALSEEDIAEDIAVAVLDSPVSGTVARPRPASGANVCPGGEFIGTMVGFGPGFLEPIDAGGACDDGAGSVRRFGEIHDWGRSNQTTGSVYDNEWGPFPIQATCSTYDGTTLGDSGGPLLDPQGHLCGVWSVVRPFPVAIPLPVPPGFEPGWFIEDFAAGVDAVESQDFLSTEKNNLGLGAKDPKGNPLGSCPEYELECYQFGGCAAAEADPDQDGVFHACDSCPTIYNPEQLVSDDDPDGNGWGAACDFCPGFQYPAGHGPVGNANYEIELALAYPQQAGPPILSGPPANPAQRALEVAHYVEAFKPDACDFVTVPRHSVALEGSDVGAFFNVIPCAPGNQFPAPVDRCNCEVLPVPDTPQCVLEHTANNFLFSPGTTVVADLIAAQEGFPQEGQNLGDSVKVRLRHCTCPLNDDTKTIGSRSACQDQCPYVPEMFDTHAVWTGSSPIVTRGANGWGNPDEDLDHDLIVGLLSGGAIAKDVTWDFTQLNPFFLDREFLDWPSPVEDGLVKVVAHGILSAGVVEMNGQPVTELSHPNTFSRSRTFHTGDARAEIKLQPPEFVFPPGDDLSWFIEIWNGGCVPPNCDPYGLLGKAAIDPNLYVAATTGLDRIVDPSPNLVQVIEGFIQGANIFVPASENPGVLSRETAPGEPFLRGVAFDPAAKSVVDVFESFVIDTTPDVGGRTPCDPPFCSPTLTGNEGLVLAGSLRIMVVVGGTDNGTDAGEPHDSAWLLQVDSNRWHETPLTASDRPAHVLGAVYRAHDVHVYVLDRDDGTVRLWRHLPGQEPALLATFPSLWSSHAQGFAVVGDQGDLLVAVSDYHAGPATHVLVCHKPGDKNPKTLNVGSGAAAAHLGHGDHLGACPGATGDDPGPHRAVIARFQVDGGGNLVFEGAKRLATPILGRPIATHDTVLFPVPGGQRARMRHVAFTEIIVPPPGQMPTIH
jgi:hypothetical protein